MIVKDLIQRLEEHVPSSSALSWDNVGLLVGDLNCPVKKVAIALDVTEEVIEFGIKEKVDMIIAHHPLIFSGQKTVTTENFIGKRIISLIQNNIACYAMHTNFDQYVMCDMVNARLQLQHTKVLDVCGETEEQTPIGIGYIGMLQTQKNLEQLANQVKDGFGLSAVKVFGDKQKMMTKVAVVPGSGKSEIAMAIQQGAEVLITGDVDHHSGIDAVAQGLQIIDAGHFGLEQVFVDYMESYIKTYIPELEVVTNPQKEPFWYC